MEIFALLIGVALFTAGVAYITLPFRQKRRRDIKLAKTSLQQEASRETVLLALRDLDFDFKTGKVSEEDYQPLRAQLMAEAAQYVEAEKQEDEQLEALIQSRRQGQKQNIQSAHCSAEANQEHCPSCGGKIQVGDLFCSSCGTRIQLPMKVVAQS